MDIRTGVLEHHLLQAKLKDKSNNAHSSSIEAGLDDWCVSVEIAAVSCSLIMNTRASIWSTCRADVLECATLLVEIVVSTTDIFLYLLYKI